MAGSNIDIRQVHYRLSKDYTSLRAKAIPQVAHKYHHRRTLKKIKQWSTFPNIFPVRSATGNNWILFVQKSPMVKNYINETSIRILAVSYHYCAKGISAFYLGEDNSIVGFNPHFFERYNERMNLNLQHPLDIMKAFFKRGVYCLPGVIAHNGHKQPVAFRADGLQLGEYHIKDGYMEWRTFISTKLANYDQQKVKHKLLKKHQAKVKRLSMANTAIGA